MKIPRIIFLSTALIFLASYVIISNDKQSVALPDGTDENCIKPLSTENVFIAQNTDSLNKSAKTKDSDGVCKDSTQTEDSGKISEDSTKTKKTDPGRLDEQKEENASSGKKTETKGSDSKDTSGIKADSSKPKEAVKEAAEQTVGEIKREKLSSSVNIEVPVIMQLPELPTGCEAVALTMVLNYYGFDLIKTSIVDEYLTYDYQNFVSSFVGDPYSYYGSGIYSPGLVKVAGKFLKNKDTNLTVKDLTGSDFDTLLGYVNDGRPVIIWNTEDMKELGEPISDYTYKDKKYYFFSEEHCVVIRGYNLDKNIVRINDSLAGVVERNIDDFKKNYIALGRQAIVIL